MLCVKQIYYFSRLSKTVFIFSDAFCRNIKIKRIKHFNVPRFNHDRKLKPLEEFLTIERNVHKSPCGSWKIFSET